MGPPAGGVDDARCVSSSVSSRWWIQRRVSGAVEGEHGGAPAVCGPVGRSTHGVAGGGDALPTARHRPRSTPRAAADSSTEASGAIESSMVESRDIIGAESMPQTAGGEAGAKGRRMRSGGHDEERTGSEEAVTGGAAAG